jgi:outer membrane protein OmpA-like peptidoglycan-associated protein
MRCHPIRWLWGLIPIAMLSWIAVHAEADRIEHDLDQRAASALHQAGYDWASVVFSGRDGVLVGTAPSRGEPRKALALVRSLWGVRTVEGRVRLAGEGTADVMARADPETSALHADRPPANDKLALPPLTSTLALLEPQEAELSAGHPVLLASSAAAPVPLAVPSPDPVRAWEQETAELAAATQSEPAADAEMTQAEPQRAALETAALAADAPSAALDWCSAAVRAVNLVEPVRFAFGEWGLDRHNRGVLDRFAALAGSCPGVGLRVVGHTDARGRAKRNLALSRRRARAVVTYLIDKGIDAGRLEAVGYGEARPVVPNDTARNRAKNRRIELEITGTSPTPLVSSP